MRERLRYVDERDKCIGLAGMVVSVFVSKADERICSISLDDDEGISFVPELLFTGNPALSLRKAFAKRVEQFKMEASMFVANVLSRARINYGGGVSDSMAREIFDILKAEGIAHYSLEADEVEYITEDIWHKMESVFANQKVCDVTASISNTLGARRTIYSADVLQLLESLC